MLKDANLRARSARCNRLLFSDVSFFLVSFNQSLPKKDIATSSKYSIATEIERNVEENNDI